MAPKAPPIPKLTEGETIALLVHILEGKQNLNYDMIADITGDKTATAYQHRFRTLLKKAKLVTEERAKGNKGRVSDLDDTPATPSNSARKRARRASLPHAAAPRPAPASNSGRRRKTAAAARSASLPNDTPRTPAADAASDSDDGFVTAEEHCGAAV